MNNLKKLALATAIAAAPLSVNALEALDDEFLGDVTGQEGITIDKEYLNTIEEFKYVDGDVGGGAVSIKNLEIGDFDASGNLGTILEEGMMIDAAANGVLITAARISGKDTNIGSIELGNTLGTAQGDIGSIAVLNAGNEWTATVESQLGVFIEDASGNFETGLLAAATTGGTALGDYDGMNFIQGTTLISSKSDGTTGVVIATTNYSHTEEIRYADHDNAAIDDNNSISILGLTSFLDDGAGNISGATSTTTIDVESGKLVIGQDSMGSTVIDAIRIGTGDLGSIAILNNSYQGTTKIYGH